jgi:hypothetical protein
MSPAAIQKRPDRAPAMRSAPLDDERQAEARGRRRARGPLDPGRVFPLAPTADLERDRGEDHDETDRQVFDSNQNGRLLRDGDEARRGDRADRPDQRLAREAGQAGLGQDAPEVDRDRRHDEAGQGSERVSSAAKNVDQSDVSGMATP